jgi:hypothetical protein
MAPYPDGIDTEDCKTRTLTVTETIFPTSTMDGAGAPGWGGGPGWAVASAPPNDGSQDSNSVVLTGTSIAGTALAQTPSSLFSSQVATTATIGLASTSSSPAASNSNTNSTYSNAGSSNAAQIAGPVIGGIAGVGIIALLLLWCCSRKARPKLRFKIKRKTVEDKENVERLRQAEAIAADRERALQDLEDRRRERDTQARTFMGGFDFGSLEQDSGHANGVEPVPRHTTAPRSPRWI